jgi:molybdate transport system ATP-binding protein
MIKMSDTLIEFTDAGFRKYDRVVFPHTNWKLSRGEHWAITGANGSGKTTFLEIIEGQWLKIRGEVRYHLPKEAVASVRFSDRSVNYGNFYYQQRYHATETEGITTVREFLHLHGDDIPGELHELNMLPLLNMEIIKLSNGQFRKMVIMKALLKKPRLLLLDNLFTGLDTQTGAFIADTLTHIADTGAQIIMTADAGALPAVITHVVQTKDNRLYAAGDRSVVRRSQLNVQRLPPSLPAAPPVDFTTVAGMDGVTIRYGNHTVIDHVHWLIRHGEKWALTGPNGAGKSMLLSLIFADHPQAYANRMILFDRQRGSGESIWEIKDRIGFVSPEMHLYNRRHISCRELVTEALHGNPYARRAVTDEEMRLTDELFAYFSLTDIADVSFQRISTGQQNMTLLIRALVKNPPVLILDEAFQGLDAEKIELARRLLDEYCQDRTLIFVSHHPEELPSCIHRYLYIDRGKAEEKPVKNPS